MKSDVTTTADDDVGPDLWIRVEYLRPVYHGLTESGQADWPVSPHRLVGALLAGAYACEAGQGQSGALAVIRDLTSNEQPRMLVPRSEQWPIPATYAPRTGHGKPFDFLDRSVLGLTNSAKIAKPQGAQLLTDPRFWFLVPGAGELAGPLAQAAAAVPYLGRSMDVCSVTVGAGESAEMDEAAQRNTHQWCFARDTTGGLVRGWTPGSVDWYEMNHQILVAGGDRTPVLAAPFVRMMEYQNLVATTGTDVTVIPVHPTSPAALAKRVYQGLGHERGWTTDASWFVCVRAAHDHADGKAAGIGITCPSGARQSVLSGAVAAVSHALHGDEPAPTPAGSFWTSGRFWGRASQRWVSATPLRAFPDIRVLQHLLGEEIEGHFGARAEIVQAERAPLHAWQRRWPQDEDLRDGFAQWWLELLFTEPIDGPLLLGKTTDRGFGLFAPADAREQES